MIIYWMKLLTQNHVNLHQQTVAYILYISSICEKKHSSTLCFKHSHMNATCMNPSFTQLFEKIILEI